MSSIVSTTHVVTGGNSRSLQSKHLSFLELAVGPMTQMPREPEAFGEQVARILRRQFPERNVELAGPMDLVLNGKHLGLENLYRMVQCEPDRGVDIVENYLDRLVEGDSISSVSLPLSVAKPRIMPRIQPISIFPMELR